MGISDRDVRSAAPTGARKPLTVSQSKSTTSESAGIVGTAHSRAANTSTLSAASIAAAAERKISSETLDKLGVVSDTVYFPDVEAKAHAFSFPYRDGHKYRSVEGKHFVSQKGFKISFWGEDEAINSRKDFVCIVEGEMDRCALVEAGLSPDTVLSVPNGSARDDKGPSENPFEVAGYQYVLEALKRGLHKKKRFIWCGDADEAGMSLRADMAHLFGAARFYFVDWPEGCNDANAVLKSDGPDYLRERVLDGNLPWPTNGLYRLHEIPETAPLQTWTTGMPGWDRYIKLAPGTLSVATGYPNHGKTRLWAQIWTQIARRYKIVVAVATFETRAKPHYRKMIRESYHHLAEWKQTEEQKLEADAFINAHFLFLIHPDRRPDLKWFLDQAEIAVVRHGASVTQIDPWNRLEAARNRNETETDFIGRCLRESHGFSQDLNCHLQVVAHPRMPDGKAKYLPPDLFSVSGSAHWNNMVDQGFCVHRPKMYDKFGERLTTANFYHLKAKFEELGFPCRLPMDYDLAQARYKCGPELDARLPPPKDEDEPEDD